MVTHQLTVRELRGMAIARRDEVEIKRLNKLTYKVRSQSNPDTSYTVIRTYNEGWTCECPDYTFRQLECKHIHAVKFSKLLRKKVYEDTFANVVNYNTVD